VSHIFCPPVGERVAAISRASGVVAAVQIKVLNDQSLMIRASNFGDLLCF